MMLTNKRMTDFGWPLAGLRWFLAHPRLWWRPLALHAVALLLLLGCGVGTVMAWWPHEGTWYWYAFHACLALGLGVVSMGMLWLVLVPILLAPVLDSLAIAVFRERGIEFQELPFVVAVHAGVRVVWRTLPLRLGWLSLGLAGAFLGPAGPFLSSIAVGRIAVMDAYDIALGTQGFTSEQRLAFYAAGGTFFSRSAVTAGLLQLALAFTLLGWLLWMPALVCGAALRCAQQSPQVDGNT